MKKPLLLYIILLILIPTFVVSIIYKSMNASVNNETKKNKSANTETKINIGKEDFILPALLVTK